MSDQLVVPRYYRLTTPAGREAGVQPTDAEGRPLPAPGLPI